uniref:(northern house mosquito) hypothetical protein n=1 Tax=Culex pipiens TaxID=7175 RepID=A0A8D8DDJ0_CULPI
MIILQIETVRVRSSRFPRLKFRINFLVINLNLMDTAHSRGPRESALDKEPELNSWNGCLECKLESPSHSWNGFSTEQLRGHRYRDSSWRRNGSFGDLTSRFPWPDLWEKITFFTVDSAAHFFSSLLAA